MSVYLQSSSPLASRVTPQWPRSVARPAQPPWCWRGELAVQPGHRGHKQGVQCSPSDLLLKAPPASIPTARPQVGQGCRPMPDTQGSGRCLLLEERRQEKRQPGGGCGRPHRDWDLEGSRSKLSFRLLNPGNCSVPPGGPPCWGWRRRSLLAVQATLLGL